MTSLATPLAPIPPQRQQQQQQRRAPRRSSLSKKNKPGGGAGGSGGSGGGSEGRRNSSSTASSSSSAKKRAPKRSLTSTTALSKMARVINVWRDFSLRNKNSDRKLKRSRSLTNVKPNVVFRPSVDPIQSDDPDAIIHDVFVEVCEFDPKEASLTITDDNWITEQHDDIPWYEQPYEELPWWEYPDLEEDDEITAHVKEVIRESMDKGGKGGKRNNNANSEKWIQGHADRVEALVMSFVLKLRNRVAFTELRRQQQLLHQQEVDLLEDVSLGSSHNSLDQFSLESYNRRNSLQSSRNSLMSIDELSAASSEQQHQLLLQGGPLLQEDDEDDNEEEAAAPALATTSNGPIKQDQQEIMRKLLNPSPPKGNKPKITKEDVAAMVLPRRTKKLPRRTRSGNSQQSHSVLDDDSISLHSAVMSTGWNKLNIHNSEMKRYRKNHRKFHRSGGTGMTPSRNLWADDHTVMINGTASGGGGGSISTAGDDSDVKSVQSFQSSPAMMEYTRTRQAWMQFNPNRHRKREPKRVFKLTTSATSTWMDNSSSHTERTNDDSSSSNVDWHQSDSNLDLGNLGKKKKKKKKKKQGMLDMFLSKEELKGPDSGNGNIFDIMEEEQDEQQDDSPKQRTSEPPLLGKKKKSRSLSPKQRASEPLIGGKKKNNNNGLNLLSSAPPPLRKRMEKEPNLDSDDSSGDDSSNSSNSSSSSSGKGPDDNKNKKKQVVAPIKARKQGDFHGSGSTATTARSSARSASTENNGLVKKASNAAPAIEKSNSSDAMAQWEAALLEIEKEKAVGDLKKQYEDKDIKQTPKAQAVLAASSVKERIQKLNGGNDKKPAVQPPPPEAEEQGKPSTPFYPKPSFAAAAAPFKKKAARRASGSGITSNSFSMRLPQSAPRRTGSTGSATNRQKDESTTTTGDSTGKKTPAGPAARKKPEPFLTRRASFSDIQVSVDSDLDGKPQQTSLKKQEDDPKMRLVMLRHAAMCTHTQKGAVCPSDPKCSQMKELLRHMMSCKHQSCTVPCPFPGCHESKNFLIMMHKTSQVLARQRQIQKDLPPVVSIHKPETTSGTGAAQEEDEELSDIGSFGSAGGGMDNDSDKEDSAAKKGGAMVDRSSKSLPNTGTTTRRSLSPKAVSQGSKQAGSNRRTTWAGKPAAAAADGGSGGGGGGGGQSPIRDRALLERMKKEEEEKEKIQKDLRKRHEAVKARVQQKMQTAQTQKKDLDNKFVTEAEKRTKDQAVIMNRHRSDRSLDDSSIEVEKPRLTPVRRKSEGKPRTSFQQRLSVSTHGVRVSAEDEKRLKEQDELRRKHAELRAKMDKSKVEKAEQEATKALEKVKPARRKSLPANPGRFTFENPNTVVKTDTTTKTGTGPKVLPSNSTRGRLSQSTNFPPTTTTTTSKAAAAAAAAVTPATSLFDQTDETTGMRKLASDVVYENQIEATSAVAKLKAAKQAKKAKKVKTKK